MRDSKHHDEVLIHYGILGMKWGVRRSDAQLARARGENPKRRTVGEWAADRRKAKYAKQLAKDGAERSTNPKYMTSDQLKTANTRTSLENRYNQLHPAAETKTAKAKRLVDQSSNAVNAVTNAVNSASSKPAKTVKGIENMTDKELRDKINRANLENQYISMFGESEVSKGRENAMNILAGTGAVLAVGSSALGIALAIKELRGK